MTTVGEIGSRAAHTRSTGEGTRGAVSNLRGALRTGLVGVVVLAAFLVALGYAIRGPLGGVRHWDADVSHWFFAQRTATGNTLSEAGTWLAETPTIVVIGLVSALVLLARRRFHGAALIVGGLLVEVVTYLIVVSSVDRPRPAHQLEHRFTGGYPSGHIAAAITLYGLLAYLCARRVRSRAGRALLFAVPVVVAAAVGTARLYREMHHLSDVVAGVLLGVGALVVASLLARHVPDADAGEVGS